jgi:hypothetical protein
MSTNHEYTWKHGISILSQHTLQFSRPLLVGMIFVDLLNGEAYRVHSLYKAKGLDRSGTTMPEDVVQTFPSGSVTEDQLAALREKHNYQVNNDMLPREDFAILEKAVPTVSP